jgi:CBS-domain-containing membrane protein
MNHPLELRLHNPFTMPYVETTRNRGGSMSEYTEVERVRFYCGETDRRDGRPLYEILVEQARLRGAAGATVVRGVLGFGAGSVIHTAKILRLSEDLPMIVEIVDRPERMAVLLPHLEALAPVGLITRERISARFHCPVFVRDVMTVDVATVAPEAPLAEVVRLLLTRRVKAVPVVAAGDKVLGLITGGDLLTRGGMEARLSLQDSLPAEDRAGELSRLAGKTAKDIMTTPAVTVRDRTSLREAARIMTKKALKRLPVVSEEGKLIGIVSRADILRSAADLAPAAEALPRFTAGLFQSARDVMFTDVPTAGPDEALPEVVGKLVGSPLRRVVVVDATRKVLGIVLDGDLLARCGPAQKPGLIAALFSRRRDEGTCPLSTAREVMQREVYTVTEDASLMSVLQKMVSSTAKRLVVVDDDGKLLGMVDREAILRVIAGG